jgi:dihydroxyacetone kinase DhaKLM complex PTS-EIIA-like component DhaM
MRSRVAELKASTSHLERVVLIDASIVSGAYAVAARHLSVAPNLAFSAKRA